MRLPHTDKAKQIQRDMHDDGCAAADNEVQYGRLKHTDEKTNAHVSIIVSGLFCACLHVVWT